MKTFETEKHNIPEGATHYSDETENNNFCWYIIKEDGAKIFVVNGVFKHWQECINQHEDSDVKPIPTTEPKYRYEKVTDSIFDLKEEFGRGELLSLKKGDIGIYREVKEERYLAEAIFHGTLYRHVEVTERELFIEEACERCGWDVGSAAASMIGDMYDAGCRFVNGKG